MDQDEVEEKAEDLQFLIDKARKVYDETGTIDDEMKREFIRFYRSVPDSEEIVREFCHKFGDPEAIGDVGARGCFSLHVDFESFENFSLIFKSKILNFKFGKGEKDLEGLKKSEEQEKPAELVESTKN